MSRQIAGLVLAAGLGSRMGGPKAEIVVDGVRLLDRATSALATAGCVPVVAVVQPGVAGTDAILVPHPQPALGLRSSLALGLGAVPGSVDAVAVTLVDMPGVTSDAINEVIAGWASGRIAVGVCEGRRTHPIVMAPTQWHAALELAEPDEGARRYLALHPDLIDEVPITIDPIDLDEPADLARWRSVE